MVTGSVRIRWRWVPTVVTAGLPAGSATVAMVVRVYGRMIVQWFGWHGWIVLGQQAAMVVLVVLPRMWRVSVVQVARWWRTGLLGWGVRWFRWVPVVSGGAARWVAKAGQGGSTGRSVVDQAGGGVVATAVAAVFGEGGRWRQHRISIETPASAVQVAQANGATVAGAGCSGSMAKYGAARAVMAAPKFVGFDRW